MDRLWGEIDDDDVLHAVKPISPIIISPALRMTCHVPALEVPSTGNPTTEKLMHPSSASVTTGGSNIILHSLQLQRYITEMRQLITEAHSKLDTSQFGDVELPQAIKLPTRYNKGSAVKPYSLERFGPHKRLKLEEAGLTSTAMHTMLRRSVATLCVFMGYDKSSNRALDVLCGILSEFLRKFCTLLRFNSDHKDTLPDSQDAIERSLLDCGIGGREAIHQYWQKEVCRRARKLTNKAKDLQEEYNHLLEPQDKSLSADPILPSLSITSIVHVDDSSQSQEEEMSLDSIETRSIVVASEVPSTPFMSPEFGAFNQFSEHMSDSDMSMMKSISILPKRRSMSSTHL